MFGQQRLVTTADMSNSATPSQISTITLRDAVAAARGGDTAHASALASDALAAGGDPAPLRAFLGMLSARAGDLTAAAEQLHGALAARPTDATIACNLIAVLIDSGRYTEALQIATEQRARTDPSLRITRYRGFLFQTLGDYHAAVAAYERVLASSPDDFESWNNLGNARSAAGDPVGSVAALERAVALAPHVAPTRLNLADALRAAGREGDADAALEQAATDFPEDSRPLHALYVATKRAVGRVGALDFITRAAGREPDNTALQVDLGVELGLALRTAESEAAFRQAITINPRATDAYVGLAINYEHTNRGDALADLLVEAERNKADAGVLAFIRAFDQRRLGQFVEALASIDQVPDTIEPERAAHLRAVLLDRLGQTDVAFEWFADVNRLHAADPSDPLSRAQKLRESLTAEIAVMTPAWIATWSPSVPPPERPDPVFLVGFPRSGTTLLDTILMGHPDTVVLEEQPPLNIVEREHGGLTAIAALDEPGIVAARTRYWAEVEAITPVPSGRLLIDKSPLYLTKAALIHRLFPNARFILALRHPCDVVLSCLMSNFKLNDAMSNFLRVEDAATFYDVVFRHWERAWDVLPLNVHVVNYERLVADSVSEVRPLFDFLDLAWHAAALEHDVTAKNRGLITTASYAQVTEPIYSRAIGRWERYRAQLAPALPILSSWVDKLGYTM